MDCHNYFADDYVSARLKFREAAESAGAELVTFENDGQSPEGEALTTDVALIGNPAAENVLVANCGTHGIEGFCGSGALVGWMRSGGHQALGKEVRAVLIHAINPYGFAWLRRVNEDNVDLNRNFIAHEKVHPDDPDFSALMPVLLPERWNGESEAAFEAAWDDLVAARGAFEAQAIISRGQYCEPGGIFFGGRAPTWSNRVFRDIVGRFVKGAGDVGFVDIHTGLGTFGAAELIHFAPGGSAAEQRLLDWYRHGLTSLVDGTTASAARTDGLIDNAMISMLPDARVTAVTVEFGTYPLQDVLRALRADNWLHLRGDLDSQLGRRLKAEIRELFYPDSDDWKELISLRTRQILNRAVRGLKKL